MTARLIVETVSDDEGGGEIVENVDAVEMILGKQFLLILPFIAFKKCFPHSSSLFSLQSMRSR